MVGVTTAIHFDIAWIVCKLTFVFIPKHERIAGLREKTIEELDVAWMKPVIKIVVAGVMNDQDTTLFQQRFVSIEIEVIAKAHYLYKQWIKNRVNVVWRNVRNTGNQNIALTPDGNRVLFKTFRNNLLVNGFCF